MSKRQYLFLVGAVITAILGIITALVLLFTKPADTQVNNYVGKSAYQSALDTGFKGTELEWVKSLQAAPAKDGEKGDTVVGPKGENSVSTHTETIVEKQTTVEKQVPLKGENGREVEMRTNPLTKDIEWRYSGTRGWNVLLEICELKDTCEAKNE